MPILYAGRPNNLQQYCVA